MPPNLDWNKYTYVTYIERLDPLHRTLHVKPDSFTGLISEVDPWKKLTDNSLKNAKISKEATTHLVSIS